MPWHPAVPSDTLPDGEAVEASAAGVALALYRLSGTVFATQAICTHAQAHLSEGYIEGELIECPLHAAQFHIPTGKAHGGLAAIDLCTYATREVDGMIEVEVAR